jgi:NADP-dependent 3-hydroxy acid dehydrogenase YdfG
VAFQYKHVVLVGATSGTRKATTDCLITTGSKVAAVGQRKDGLEEFVKKCGLAKTAPFNIDDGDKIP